MSTFAKLVNQYQRDCTIRELEVAVRRLCPRLPEAERRSLQEPLQQWVRGAVTFLASPQKREDEQGLDAIQFSIQRANKNKPLITTMFGNLKREVDAAAADFPADCALRWSCALLYVLDKLFGDAEPVTPRHPSSHPEMQATTPTTNDDRAKALGVDIKIVEAITAQDREFFIAVPTRPTGTGRMFLVKVPYRPLLPATKPLSEFGR
jgi:hypothetical protein